MHAGLFVPTSDIDLVVMDSKCDNIQSGLKALATVLARKGVAKSIQVTGFGCKRSAYIGFQEI